MYKTTKLLIILITLSTYSTYAQNKHGKTTKYPSYKGLIMAGYQGWFRAPGDGTDSGWGHYGRGNKFDIENNTIDFWPDVTEYEKTYKTSFKHANGKNAEVFSSADKSTTELHFKWMRDYGVYGGCSVMLGVPTYFRDLDKDCIHDPYLHELIESVDIVLPWMVQRFTPYLQKPIDHQRDHIIADIKWCKEHRVDYVPIAYPGFSWRNLSLGKPELSRYTAYSAIPRLGGRF